MSTLKQMKAIIILFLVLLFTKGYYEVFRLYCFFLPVYICFIYFELKPYYSNYSVIRFSNNIRYHKKIISIVINYVFIGATALSIDKLINVRKYPNTIELAPLFLLYFLFLSIAGLLILIPKLSLMRGILFSIILAILGLSEMKIFSFLKVLNDPRKWNTKSGISEGIIIFLGINIVICSVYYILNKCKKGE